MKICAITDLEKFFELIDKCEGKVELVTKDGDRYSLNSKISQLVAVTKIFSNDEISEVELIASEPKEEEKILDFFQKMNC